MPDIINNQKFDAIVVLGASVKSGGRPSHALKRRLEHDVTLFEDGAPEVLMLSGGTKEFPPSEAEVMKKIAVEEVMIHG